MKTVYELELHEATQCDKYHITRVPGGWLYKAWGGVGVVFVPFHNEFWYED